VTFGNASDHSSGVSFAPPTRLRVSRVGNASNLRHLNRAASLVAADVTPWKSSTRMKNPAERKDGRTGEAVEFSEEHIIAILREQEAGVAVTDLCRKHGVSSPTAYK